MYSVIHELIDTQYFKKQKCYKEHVRFYHICKDDNYLCASYENTDTQCFFCLGGEYSLSDDEVLSLHKEHLWTSIDYKQAIKDMLLRGSHKTHILW